MAKGTNNKEINDIFYINHYIQTNCCYSVFVRCEIYIIHMYSNIGKIYLLSSSEYTVRKFNC